MPDQRKKGKKQVAVWLSEEEKSTLQKLAKLEGRTMSEVLKGKIYDYLKKQK